MNFHSTTASLSRKRMKSAFQLDTQKKYQHTFAKKTSLALKLFSSSNVERPTLSVFIVSSMISPTLENNCDCKLVLSYTNKEVSLNNKMDGTV